MAIYEKWILNVHLDLSLLNKELKLNVSTHYTLLSSPDSGHHLVAKHHSDPIAIVTEEEI